MKYPCFLFLKPYYFYLIGQFPYKSKVHTYNNGSFHASDYMSTPSICVLNMQPQYASTICVLNMRPQYASSNTSSICVLNIRPQYASSNTSSICVLKYVLNMHPQNSSSICVLEYVLNIRPHCAFSSPCSVSYLVLYRLISNHKHSLFFKHK